MITFIDGPAQGQTLMLKRAPKLLRVVEWKGQWDALDQLDDKPRVGEKIYAYVMVAAPTRMHVYRGGGRGGWYFVGDYRFIPEQPDDAILRDNTAWQGWCFAHRSYVSHLSQP